MGDYQTDIEPGMRPLGVELSNIGVAGASMAAQTLAVIAAMDKRIGGAMAADELKALPQ